MPRIRFAIASAIIVLALAAPCRAQGKGKEPKSTPPGRSALPANGGSAPGAPGTVPFAWIDDATTLTRGNLSVSLSTLFWHGTDLHETDAPIVGVAIGIADRVQLGASIPHVV